MRKRMNDNLQGFEKREKLKNRTKTQRKIKDVAFNTRSLSQMSTNFEYFYYLHFVNISLTLIL